MGALRTIGRVVAEAHAAFAVPACRGGGAAVAITVIAQALSAEEEYAPRAGGEDSATHSGGAIPLFVR